MATANGADSVGFALFLLPFCLAGAIPIAIWGAGRNIAPPGEYTLDDLPMAFRWRRVHSLRGRQRVFATMTALVTIASVVAAIFQNWALSVAALDVVVLLGGITIALWRSSQMPGRGPRLRDRIASSANSF